MCTLCSPCADPRCPMAWERLNRLVQGELRRGGLLPPDQILDLAQESLCAIIERIRFRQTPDELRALAITIAQRARAAWLRRPANRCRQWHDAYNDTLGVSTPHCIERRLVEALALMADDARAVFRAIYLDGLTVREAAKALGYSIRHTMNLYRESRDFFLMLCE